MEKSSLRLRNWWVVVIIVWLPILWLFSASLRPDNEFFQGPLSLIPRHINFHAFIEILNTPGMYRSALINSCLISMMTMIVSITIGSLTAFYFVHLRRYKSRSRHLGLAVISARFLPTAAIIPGIYWAFNYVNLLDSKTGLVLVQVVMGISLTVLLMCPVFARIKESYIEQANIEGATSYSLLRWIIWPTVRFPLFIIALINFAVAWNEYFLANMLSETIGSQPLSVIVAGGVGQYRVRFALLAAGGLITVLPAVFITIILLITHWTQKRSPSNRSAKINLAGAKN